ncbi:MAG TPA: penicillin-binding transpeptidase domain-containing protein [Acidimicrobiales bacterium]
MEDTGRGAPHPGNEQPSLPGLDLPSLPGPDAPSLPALDPASLPGLDPPFSARGPARPRAETDAPGAAVEPPETPATPADAPPTDVEALEADRPTTEVVPPEAPAAATEPTEAPGGPPPAPDALPPALPDIVVPTRHRRHLLVPIALASVAVVVLAAAGVTAFFLLRDHQPPIPPPTSASSAYLAAWNHRDWAAMAALVDRPGADFTAVNSAALTDIQAGSASFTAGAVTLGRGRAAVAFSAHLLLTGLGPWDYTSTLPLVVVKRHWLVQWSPAVINPQLVPGAHLARTRSLPPRGEVLAEDGRPLASVSGASGLVGSVRPATAATAAVLGPPYLAGDEAGTSGLEAAEDAQLAGLPSGDVLVVDAAGQSLATLHHFAGAAGRSVTTTIDPNMQALADRVLAPVGEPAAFVAIDTNTFAVRAIVSHPDGGYPRALVGTYPPGSTFKVVTTTAALEAGFTPTTPIACPPSISVDGRAFTNAEHEQLGTISFQEAFAKSCNTAFIGTAKKLTDAQLEAAAGTYGINTKWDFPLPHFTGQLPPPISPVEHAADAIGQGRVAVSPLQMASIAAAVANGAWQPPRLVAAAPPGTSSPLPPSVVTNLRLFMRSVVTSGTGTAANVAGDPVFGKTGTAEFGSGNPPRTHAWFIGWRDNTAFAVIVEGGGFGGDVAAPLAARFLAGL